MAACGIVGPVVVSFFFPVVGVKWWTVRNCRTVVSLRARGVCGHFGNKSHTGPSQWTALPPLVGQAIFNGWRVSLLFCGRSHLSPLALALLKEGPEIRGLLVNFSPLKSCSAGPWNLQSGLACAADIDWDGQLVDACQ